MSGARTVGVLALGAIIAALAYAPAALASAGQDAVVKEVVTKTVDDADVGEAAIDCGPNARAIGGGVVADAPSFPPNFIIADGPLGPGGTTAGTNDFDAPRYWYTALLNVSGATQTYRFYAVCSASSDATIQAQGFLLPAVGGIEGSSVGCPAGQRAISGGFSTTATPSRRSDGVLMSQPLDASGSPAETLTGNTAISWAVEVRNEGLDAKDYKVFALCSPTSTATVQETSYTSDTYKPGHAATCPEGSRATGGGSAPVNGLVGNLFEIGPSDAAGSPTLSAGDVPRGWYGRVDSTAWGLQTYRTYAMCEAERAPLPPSTPATGQRAAALAKCKKKHSRKAKKKCKKKAALLPV